MVVGVVIVIVVGVMGWTDPEAGREDAVLLISDTGLDEGRERPDARRDTAGDGGAGRDEVRDVTDWVLSL